MKDLQLQIWGCFLKCDGGLKTFLFSSRFMHLASVAAALLSFYDLYTTNFFFSQAGARTVGKGDPVGWDRRSGCPDL